MISPLASKFRHYHAALWLAGSLICMTASAAQPQPLVLLIQPTLGEEATKRTFQPLADFLAEAIGTTVTIVTKPNFLAHWDTVRRNAGYDLVLDDAHFTDYRVQKFGFEVLAKMPGTMSYTLVMLREKRVIDPQDLAGKTVASYGPPSIGATRLGALFPNPARRPAIIEIGSANEGIDMVLGGKVVAAMLPTSSISQHVGAERLASVTTTEPTLQMALSVSPRVAAAARGRIRAGLASAAEDAKPPILTGVARFEAATSGMYANQARLLKQYWGY